MGMLLTKLKTISEAGLSSKVVDCVVSVSIAIGVFYRLNLSLILKWLFCYCTIQLKKLTTVRRRVSHSDISGFWSFSCLMYKDLGKH